MTEFCHEKFFSLLVSTTDQSQRRDLFQTAISELFLTDARNFQWNLSKDFSFENLSVDIRHGVMFCFSSSSSRVPACRYWLSLSNNSMRHQWSRKSNYYAYQSTDLPWNRNEQIVVVCSVHWLANRRDRISTSCVTSARLEIREKELIELLTVSFINVNLMRPNINYKDDEERERESRQSWNWIISVLVRFKKDWCFVVFDSLPTNFVCNEN